MFLAASRRAALAETGAEQCGESGERTAKTRRRPRRRTMSFAGFAAKIMRAQMAYQDNKRIATQRSVGGVAVTEFAYVEDGNHMHRLNLYRP